jgi:phosphoenolpyruvate carboxylase
LNLEFLENFNVRTVPTAHPTQFYRAQLRGIINDLTDTIPSKQFNKYIKELLAQLGKTPFYSKWKANPLEAVGIWYLENVFYRTSNWYGALFARKNLFQSKRHKSTIIKLEFWPGGDRDGKSICYHRNYFKSGERLKLILEVFITLEILEI